MTFTKRLRYTAAVLSALAVGLVISAVPGRVSAQTPVQLGVTEDTPAANIIDYQPVAENGSLAMFADLRKGAFAILNKSSGRFWYSSPNDLLLDEYTRGSEKLDLKSQIVVEYIDRAAEAITANAQTINSQKCVKNDELKITEITNGLRVEYSFSALGFRIPVEYTLDGDGFNATVLADKIDEGKTNWLVGVRLLPFFGAATRSESGYLMIPDGSGAVIDFSSNTGLTYDFPVYGEEYAVNKSFSAGKRETVRMPVFGIVNGSDAVLGIISEGEGAGSLTARSAGDSFGYSCVGSTLGYRLITSKTMFESDKSNRRIIYHITRPHFSGKRYTVKYRFLSGEDAGYIGMAKCYREYLMSEKKLVQRDTSPKFNVDIYGAIDTKATFLGIQYTKMLPLTTFAEALKITEALEKSGIRDVSVRYIGWTNSGIDNIKYPKSLKPLGTLGGGKGWKKLSAGISSLYAEVECQQFSRSGNGIKINRDAAKASFGEVAAQYSYMRSVYASRLDKGKSYLLSPSKLTAFTDRIIKDCVKRDITALSMSTLGSRVYSDFDPDSGCYRDETVEILTGILKNTADKRIIISSNSANAYAFPYVSKIFSAPVSSGNHDGYTADIPFYQAVLHGIIPFTVNPVIQSDDPRLTLLKAAETGSELLYSTVYRPSSLLSSTTHDELYSTQYSLWMDSASEGYSRYSEYLSAVSGKTIISHCRISDEITKTVFDGGISVYVNYSDSEASADGITLEPMNYIWSGGNEH